MIRQLSGYLTKPQLYAPSTGEFWNDPHISKGMLEAHLNPQEEAATRRHEFLDRSVQWISKIAPPSRYKSLLDLGCGPGLYAQRFHEAGYSVTGVDFPDVQLHMQLNKRSCLAVPLSTIIKII